MEAYVRSHRHQFLPTATFFVPYRLVFIQFQVLQIYLEATSEVQTNPIEASLLYTAAHTIFFLMPELDRADAWCYY